MVRVATAALAVCVLAGAATAGAANAAGVVDDGEHFVAAAGVADDLTVAREGTGLRFTDPAGVDGVFACVHDRPGDATTVLCPKVGFGASVDLGDGDDRVTFVGTLPGDVGIVDAGPGNDLIADAADAAHLN